MADFGMLPMGERFGMVPAWSLKLSDVARGPKRSMPAYALALMRRATAALY